MFLPLDMNPEAHFVDVTYLNKQTTKIKMIILSWPLIIGRRAWAHLVCLWNHVKQNMAIWSAVDETPDT